MKNSFCDFISRLDSFGVPVNLTVNGNRTFQTKMGGFVTLIFSLIVLIYAIYFGNIMVVRTNSMFNQDTISNYYDERHMISSVTKAAVEEGKITNVTNFNIAFGVFTDDLELVDNFSSYFKLRVRNYACVTKQGAGKDLPA